MPQLDAIGIVSADLDRSRAFYKLLGVDVAEGSDHVEATGNQVALAFACGSIAEVDETYARVAAAGFHGEKEPWNAFWGYRYAQLVDPDGVPVDLFAPLS